MQCSRKIRAKLDFGTEILGFDSLDSKVVLLKIDHFSYR